MPELIVSDNYNYLCPIVAPTMILPFDGEAMAEL